MTTLDAGAAPDTAAAPASGRAVARRGLVLVLSSPSGAGKTTLTRRLLRDGAGDLSISVTTRPRRPSEVEGCHYHFVDRDAFAALRERGELLEWAEVHGNLYGTPRRPVEQALAAGRDMVFDIDIQGAAQVRRELRGDVVTVFVLPPSMAELRRRLVGRAEDAAEVIERRLANARAEIAHWADYDYVLVNDDIDRSYQNLTAILVAERLRRARGVGLTGFVAGLLAEETSSAAGPHAPGDR